MHDIITSMVPQSIQNFLKKRQQIKYFREWKRKGSLEVPPPHWVKQQIIKDYQQKYKCQILVETGTYLGDMVEAQKKYFKKIFSIELSAELYKKAKNRFKNNNNVHIIQGDSGKALAGLMSDILEPAIFWLDGHYSAGITAKGDKVCPVFEELESVLKDKTLHHIILIDDARCYTGTDDFPAITEITDFIKARNDKYTVEIKYDVIRYVLP